MANFKQILRNKKWLRTIITVVLVLGVVGGLIGGIVAIMRNTDKIDNALTYKTIGATKYAIGGLDGNGNYMNTDQSIYTKDAFECQGLNCTLDFDNDVSYQIYFYDQNNEFVHTTGKLTGAFVQDSVPFFAKYARIVITPNDDNKISLFEKGKYARQLNTTVYREQGYKNYTENLLSVAKTGYKFDYDTGVDTIDASMDLSNYIKVAGYSESLIFRDDADAGFRVCGFYDAEKSFVSFSTLAEIASLSFTTSEGVKYYSIDLDELSSSVVYLRICWDNGHHVPFVFCR